MTCRNLGVQFSHTTERIVKPNPGRPELYSGDYLREAFSRRRTPLGITRFIQRYIRDLELHRFSNSFERERLAFEYCMDNLDMHLGVHPDQNWQEIRDQLHAKQTRKQARRKSKVTTLAS